MFEVPASKASHKQNVFEFKIAGKTYSVPKTKFLPVGVIEALEAPESSTTVLDVFGKKGTRVGEAVRSLDAEQLEALVAAWQADSDVSLGESEASDG